MAISNTTTPASHRHEVRVWALVLALGLATLIAGYILWAKITGF